MTEETPTPRATRLEPLSLLWRFFAAPQTLLTLMGLVAVTLVLGTLIPQIPPRAVEDPEAWMALQSQVLVQMSGPIGALGLFDVHHTFWFHLLLALTGLTLFVWVVDSADLAWRATAWRIRGRELWTPAAFSAWGKYALRMRFPSSRSLRDTLAQLRGFLTQDGYRCADVPGLSDPSLVASRRALALWAEPIVYAALLIALIGLGIVGNWSWRNSDWQPAPGESRAVGHGTAFVVRLDSFALQQGDAGHGNDRLHKYRSEITWLEDGIAVRQDVVGAGRPARFHGVTVRQLGYAPTVKVRGWDDAGHSLVFQVEGMGMPEEPSVSGEVEIRYDVAWPTVPSAQQLVLIYGHDLFLALTFEPLSQEGKPALHVDLLGNGGPTRQPLAVLHESGSVVIDGLQLAVELDYRPVLRVDRRPGMGLALVGLALAVLALAVRWIVAPRLLWIAVAESKEGASLLDILALPGTRGSRWPRRLASRLQEVLVDDA